MPDAGAEPRGHRQHQRRGDEPAAAVLAEEIADALPVLRPRLPDRQHHPADAPDLQHHMTGQDPSGSTRQRHNGLRPEARPATATRPLQAANEQSHGELPWAPAGPPPPTARPRADTSPHAHASSGWGEAPLSIHHRVRGQHPHLPPIGHWSWLCPSVARPEMDEQGRDRQAGRGPGGNVRRPWRSSGGRPGCWPAGGWPGARPGRPGRAAPPPGPGRPARCPGRHPGR